MLYGPDLQLNNTTPVAVCTELASLERYYEYVAYAFVAFPALLYQEPCVDLLRLVAANRVVVELFRDVVSTRADLPHF